MAKQLWSKMQEVLLPGKVHRAARDKAPPKVIRGSFQTKVDFKNRVCSKCGDDSFLSGVLVFERSYVTGVLCRKCLNRLGRLL